MFLVEYISMFMKILEHVIFEYSKYNINHKTCKKQEFFTFSLSDFRRGYLAIALILKIWIKFRMFILFINFCTIYYGNFNEICLWSKKWGLPY